MADPVDTAEPPPSAAWCLREARRLSNEVELFKAYDIAMQGLVHWPDDDQLKYSAVLSLASAGATSPAVKKFVEFFGPERRDGTEVGSLHGRLMKDIALTRSGSARKASLLEAAGRYDAAYRRAKERREPGAYFPGINTATLHFLADDREVARALAREIIETLAARPPQQRSYYEIATLIEAHLLLDEVTQARDLVGAALAAHAREATPDPSGLSDGPDYRARSSTVKQLRLILAHAGGDAAWLETLAPPGAIHFTGHLIAAPGKPGRFTADEEPAVRRQIEQHLDRCKAAFGYGSLAAGADILFAEALLARGASLNLVLPFRKDEFIDISVQPSGANWLARFEACLARAATVRYATEDSYLGDDRLFGYCSQLAMGLALLRARHLGASAEQFAVWDGGPRAGEAGTATDVERWCHSGMKQTIIPCGQTRTTGATQGAAPSPPVDVGERRTHAMLFGDVKGFSKLTDSQLPRFVDSILKLFARVLKRHDSAEFVNTWGDGLFVVFDDAGRAARCALELQEEMEKLDLAAAGLPPTMALRMGGHLGPVYPTQDPVLERRNFFGAHVSRAARIEPVTPEGCVYVTETFAAVLALYNGDEFACDYVGMTEAAKHYGAMRMFLLRRVIKPE